MANSAITGTNPYYWALTDPRCGIYYTMPIAGYADPSDIGEALRSFADPSDIGE